MAFAEICGAAAGNVFEIPNLRRSEHTPRDPQDDSGKLAYEMGHEAGAAPGYGTDIFFKDIFFYADVWCWHFAVAASFLMILEALNAR